MDGERLIERRSFARALPNVFQQPVHLSSGKHRLVVKLLRGERGSSIALAIPRADGRPAKLKFTESKGPAPRWDGLSRTDAALTFTTADSMRRVLEPEVGPALAEYLAIRDGMGRDREGAKAMMASLEKAISGPALTSLRAELALGDRTVPSRVARGRATRDLEATAEADATDLQALLVRAQVALDDGRPLEALGLVKRAKAADPHPGFPTFLAEARVNLALSVEAQADLSAVQALSAQPGLCDALSLRYDLARRRDAIALSDDLVKSQEQCPGSRQRIAEHLRLRGDLAGALALYQQLLERDPSQLSVVVALANLQISLRKLDAAEATLRTAATLWPRSAALAKKLGDILELRGNGKEALAERERALRLDGGDLLLRRSVTRLRTGAEPLQDRAIDGAAAIKAHEESPGQEDTPLAYVLDAAAIEAFADGSMVDRIHIIQKALDQGGVPEVAEVAIPNGAHVLSLRTIKADGTVLEPESIENKETVSLPGVPVGDYVEYEYLMAHPTRGPGQPGFTASNFYFQISNAPNNWSTYTVLAPKGSGMAADAHNVAVGKDRVKVDGDKEVFFHEERRVAPYIPEPAGPPSPTEYLPFVSVGAGAEGNEALVKEFADAFADRAQLTVEIDQFAREAVGTKKGADAVRALYAAVMKRLSGRDSGLGQSASYSLAQDRGSRLWLLKASLESVGIPARIVAIRGFQADPAPYRFPNDNLLPFVGLYVELEKSPPLWLDTQLRFGPFGQLPEQAADDKVSWLLAEAGRPSKVLRSPAQPKQEEKQVQLKLQLSADGVLSGTGDERYFGRESAQLQDALEQMSPDQRDQALQSALSRYFGGAELSTLRLDLAREVGASMTVHYEFKAPRFGRVEGSKMLLPPLTFPSQLGRRYVQLGARRTPLFIDNTELTNTRAEIKLPRGWRIQDPLGGYQLRTRFGAFTRSERQQGEALTIDESYRLNMARIAPKDYEPFSRFAGEVDLIQSRDVVLAKQ
jgi:tetratricopeptide (TPR) repeat protein